MTRLGLDVVMVSQYPCSGLTLGESYSGQAGLDVARLDNQTDAEFTGHGLTTFERAMDRDERLMAVLGARLLEGEKKVGETAAAIELRQSGENSVLATLAVSLSESLSQVLRWAYWWNATDDTPDAVDESKVLMTLNTDFSTKGLSAQEITAVVQSWQNGTISQDTMFELFRRGEVLPDGRSNEEEQRLVATHGGGGRRVEDRRQTTEERGSVNVRSVPLRSAQPAQ